MCCFTSKILSPLEPLVFSKANLRVLCTRGECDGTKATLTKLIECLTGVQGDFSLQGRMRVWVHLQAFVAKLGAGDSGATGLAKPES